MSLFLLFLSFAYLVIWTRRVTLLLVPESRLKSQESIIVLAKVNEQEGKIKPHAVDIVAAGGCDGSWPVRYMELSASMRCKSVKIVRSN
jgi:hypothetical protein